MKLHLQVNSYNAVHVHMTLFIDGRSVGQLTTGYAESVWLHHILDKGCHALSPPGSNPVEFVSSGKFPDPSPSAMDAAVAKPEDK